MQLHNNSINSIFINKKIGLIINKIEVKNKTMPKCPYCTKELQIEDFFKKIVIKNRKGEIKKRKLGEFKGKVAKDHSIALNIRHSFCKMWVCPSCDTILGFTEYASSRS